MHQGRYFFAPQELQYCDEACHTEHCLFGIATSPEWRRITGSWCETRESSHSVFLVSSRTYRTGDSAWRRVKSCPLLYTQQTEMPSFHLRLWMSWMDMTNVETARRFAPAVWVGTFTIYFVVESLYLQYGGNGNQEPLQEPCSPESSYIRHFSTEAKELFKFKDELRRNF